MNVKIIITILFLTSISSCAVVDCRCNKDGETNFTAYQKNGNIMVIYKDEMYIKDYAAGWHNFRTGKRIELATDRNALDACVKIYNWSPKRMLDNKEERIKYDTSGEVGGRVPRKPQSP